MTTLLEILHRKAEPYKVTLTRGQKGTYGWEITVSACGVCEAVGMLAEANKRMQELFGGGDTACPA